MLRPRGYVLHSMAARGQCSLPYPEDLGPADRDVLHSPKRPSVYYGSSPAKIEST